MRKLIKPEISSQAKNKFKWQNAIAKKYVTFIQLQSVVLEEMIFEGGHVSNTFLAQIKQLAIFEVQPSNQFELLRPDLNQLYWPSIGQHLGIF